MAEIWIPLIAGFFATAAVSLMMLAKQVMRIMATMDIIGGISGMGTSRPAGWLVFMPEAVNPGRRRGGTVARAGAVADGGIAVMIGAAQKGRR